jgi:protoporphyrinogen oxidase
MINSPEKPLHWGIIGGGMLGLTIAFRLSKAGYKITLFETEKNLGGLASAWQLGDIVWDRYYHVIMLSDTRLRALLKELGLENKIEWRTTKTNFFTGSNMYPLNNAVDYIRLPALGLVDKARLAVTILYGSRIENGQKLESLSAEEWLTKLSGKSTYQNLWRPLLRSKLGSNYSKASAAYIWSVIRRFYAARRGGMKTEMFGYVPGGYQSVISAMEQQILQSGATIETGTEVTSVSSENNRIIVRSHDKIFHFDRVINTCASPIATRICSGLSEAETEQHRGILYQGIICADLLLARPLGGAYLTYITDETIPFTTVIEMSSLVNPALLHNQYLVYLPKYLPHDDPMFEMTDQEIETRFLAGLRRMYPDLSASEIKAFKISRTRYVLAVSTKDYSTRLPAMTTAVPGLFIINSAHILNASLNVDESVRLANQSVEFVIAGESGTIK